MTWQECSIGRVSAYSIRTTQAIYFEMIFWKKKYLTEEASRKKNETVDEGAAIFITVAFDKLDEERKEYNNNKRIRNAHWSRV